MTAEQAALVGTIIVVLLIVAAALGVLQRSMREWESYQRERNRREEIRRMLDEWERQKKKGR